VCARAPLPRFQGPGDSCRLHDGGIRTRIRYLSSTDPVRNELHDRASGGTSGGASGESRRTLSALCRTRPSSKKCVREGYPSTKSVPDFESAGEARQRGFIYFRRRVNSREDAPIWYEMTVSRETFRQWDIRSRSSPSPISRDINADFSELTDAKLFFAATDIHWHEGSECPRQPERGLHLIASRS